MHCSVLMCLYLLAADFSICDWNGSQVDPAITFKDNVFYVFWEDWRDFTGADSFYMVYGARVNQTGAVIDPDGKQMFRRKTNKNLHGINTSAGCDGSNFLVVFQDTC